MFYKIFLLRNLANGKVYVGQTSNEINKNIIKEFTLEILTITHSLEIADYWIEYFIEKYRADDPAKGYNFRRSLNPLDA